MKGWWMLQQSTHRTVQTAVLREFVRGKHENTHENPRKECG